MKRHFASSFFKMKINLVLEIFILIPENEKLFPKLSVIDYLLFELNSIRFGGNIRFWLLSGNRVFCTVNVFP